MRPIDLARITGISASSVRSYERECFLPPAERLPSGHRAYGEQHLAALRAARAMIAGYGWIPARDIMRCVHRGEIDTALALVDARHATNHEERETVANTIAVLSQIDKREPNAPRHPVRIGKAASLVGVSVPTVRFWEDAGLVECGRDPSSNFRVLGATGFERLRLVATLRRAGYGIDEIRRVVTALRDNDPGAALEEAKEREAMLRAQSRRTVEATAVLWRYLSRFGFVHSLDKCDGRSDDDAT